MPSFTRLRHHPEFAMFFELVHPFFWPVLYWQLVRACREVSARGRGESQVQVHWWGGITIAYLGDRVSDPSAYRPLASARPAWDDPCWSSAVPTCLSADALRALFFPRANAENDSPLGRLTLVPRACASIADTS